MVSLSHFALDSNFARDWERELERERESERMRIPTKYYAVSISQFVCEWHRYLCLKQVFRTRLEERVPVFWLLVGGGDIVVAAAALFKTVAICTISHSLHEKSGSNLEKSHFISLEREPPMEMNKERRAE